MAEFIILCVVAAMGWSYFAEWRERGAMERRIQERVALQQQYVAVARDAPSAWEGFGDALRRGGHLPEAIEAYERADMLRLRGPEPRPTVFESLPDDGQDDEPLPDGIEVRSSASMALAPVSAPQASDETVTSPATMPALLAPVGSVTPRESDVGGAEVALVPLQPGPVVGGGDLFASSEHLLAQVREETGLAVDDGPSDLPVPYTPPADGDLPVPASPDGAVGFGLQNKIRLVRLEMEQDADPAKFGQTLLTRQPICRQCGHLNPYGLRDCESCDAPLPTDSMMDSYRHEAIRREAIREAKNLVIGLFIIMVTVWFVGWLPGLAKISVTVSALIVIPFRLLHAIGDR